MVPQSYWYRKKEAELTVVASWASLEQDHQSCYSTLEVEGRIPLEAGVDQTVAEVQAADHYCSYMQEV